MLGHIFCEVLELTPRAAIRQIGLNDAAAAGGRVADTHNMHTGLHAIPSFG